MNCEWEPLEKKFKCKYCGKVVPRSTIKRNCNSGKRVDVKPPGLGTRVKNLTKAAAGHVMSGMAHCTEEQKQERYDQCSSNECGFFVANEHGGVCAHKSCGCYIRSGGKFMDKLSWASTSCPLGYWSSVHQKAE